MVRHLPFQTQQALDIIVSGTKNPPYFPAVYVSVEDIDIVALFRIEICSFNNELSVD